MEQEKLNNLLLEQCEEIDKQTENDLKTITDDNIRQELYKIQIKNLRLWVRLYSGK